MVVNWRSAVFICSDLSIGVLCAGHSCPRPHSGRPDPQECGYLEFESLSEKLWGGSPVRAGPLEPPAARNRSNFADTKSRPEVRPTIPATVILQKLSDIGRISCLPGKHCLVGQANLAFPGN